MTEQEQAQEDTESYSDEQMALIVSKAEAVTKDINGLRIDMVLEALTAVLASILATADDPLLAAQIMAEFMIATMKKTSMIEAENTSSDRTLN